MKRVLFIITVFFGLFSFAQKGQRMAYVDMNYILENVPEYAEAQSMLDGKVKKWQQKLDALSEEINTLKTDLNIEKSLLTKELISEREEDILIKKNELNRLQIAYFGPKGDLYKLRQQFAKPVQDQVYNAVQVIAKRKNYDFVVDKSSDLILLYTNSKFDISELVLNSIVKNRRKSELAEKKRERLAKTNNKTNVKETVTDADEEPEAVNTAETEITEVEGKTEQQKRLEEKIAKREALKARIKEQQIAREKKRDSLKKVADEKRTAKLKEIEDRKKKNETKD